MLDRGRFVVDDAAWEKVAPLLPGKPTDSGATGRDNRLFLEAVLWRVRTGVPWRDLPEQGRHLTSVIGAVVGQHAGDDLAGVGVHGDVELAPGPARPAVLLLVPLALAEQLQAGAVDHQVHRTMRDGPGLAAALAGGRGQATRTETGLATRIMRLSTRTAMAASPCWASKPRARSLGPMIAL